MRASTDNGEDGEPSKEWLSVPSRAKAERLKKKPRNLREGVAVHHTRGGAGSRRTEWHRVEAKGDGNQREGAVTSGLRDGVEWRWYRAQGLVVL